MRHYRSVAVTCALALASLGSAQYSSWNCKKWDKSSPGHFRGLQITLASKLGQTDGVAGEPARQLTLREPPTAEDLERILRSRTDDECLRALSAIATDNDVSARESEIIALQMANRSVPVQHTACIVLRHSRSDSRVVTDALIRATASQSLEVSRQAVDTLQRRGLSNDAALTLAAKASQIQRPETMADLLLVMSKHPDAMLSFLSTSDHVCQLLDDRRVCIRSTFAEVLSSDDDRFRAVREWSEKSVNLPANVSVMLDKKRMRDEIERRALAANGAQRRYLLTCAAALGADLSQDPFKEVVSSGIAELTTDRSWDAIATVRETSRRNIIKGFYSTVVVFDVRAADGTSKPRDVEIGVRDGDRYVRLAKQGYDSVSGRAYAFAVLGAEYDVSVLSIVDTPPRRVQRQRLVIKSPEHLSGEVSVGYDTAVVPIQLNPIRE